MAHKDKKFIERPFLMKTDSRHETMSPVLPCYPFTAKPFRSQAEEDEYDRQMYERYCTKRSRVLQEAE